MIIGLSSRKWLYFIIYYNLLCGFAIKNFAIDKTCLYLIDVIYIVLLIQNNFKISKINFKTSIITLCCLFSVIIVGALLNNVNLLNVIWGLRNQYFSLIILFASSSFLYIKDINKIFSFFFYFQILNLLCALYQYFVLGYYADANNGAFINGNGQDIFCGVLLTYYLYSYVNKKSKLWEFLFVLFSSLLIAALEEEKFIFIETLFVFSYYFIISGKISLKKILIAVTFIYITVLSVNILSDINGNNSFEILTNKEAFIEYQENAYELPRVGSSAIISKMFFTSDWQNFFGLGLGKCEESSSLSFIDSSFYNRYGWLHYNWFTFHINYLQTGWTGILLFIFFFITILINNIQGKKRCNKDLKYYYDISIVTTILCIITIWYNGTLRSYNSIIPFFILSLGNIVTRQIKLSQKITKR